MRLQRTTFWTPILSLLLIGSALGQGTAVWTVRPQWVRAHEEFLASDAMAGRGSATHDEEVTATYVASEFEGYGLTFAPGMKSFLQPANIVIPRLDGHASASFGGTTFNESSDFDLVISPAEDASGPLIHVPLADVAKVKLPPHAAVYLLGAMDPQSALDAIRMLHRAGASVIMASGTGAMAGAYRLMGSKTHTPIRLADQPASSPMNVTVMLLRSEQAGQVNAMKDGTPVAVHVRVQPEMVPRTTYNAIGYLPGTDPAAGTILLTAHLDHLGIGVPVDGDAIYNGANDDAAGTTAVLELAHALASGPRLRRSLLFVCYGSEEIGELGSTYFGEHSPVPLKSLVANLEFEMIGNQDPKMPKGVLLFTGWERSDLGPELKAHGALLGPDPYPEQQFFERSDNYALALKGVVAHTAAGWGIPPTYHQPNDDMAHLDVPFMTAAIQSLVEPVRWLAESDFTPQWKPGGRPKGTN